MIQHDTFWTLLHDTAHWEFELFLIFLFDIVVGVLVWPFVKKHWQHHVERDRETVDYSSDASGEVIPGWRVAIFRDATGTPYWRSDGRPLTEPQPETEEGQIFYKRKSQDGLYIGERGEDDL